MPPANAMKDHQRYEWKGLNTEKIAKTAKSWAEARHQQDTEARVELLRDEKGNVVRDSQGRAVEKVLGPLTKPGVPVGRYFDVAGRRSELHAEAGRTRGINAAEDAAAIQRAQAGLSSHYAVQHGPHDWSRNIAYGQFGATAGTTIGHTPHGHGATNAPGGGGGPGPGPGGNVERHMPVEFRKRPTTDFERASYHTSSMWGRAFLQPGAMGQRAGASLDRFAQRRDERKGMIRPVIGYRPQGGDINFSA